jgi:hypothetical protein
VIPPVSKSKTPPQEQIILFNMPHSCSHGYCNGGDLICVVRRIVDDESASGADIATNQAHVVGIDQTEQTLSIPHQCRKEYRERVKQIYSYRWLMENEEMSIRSKSVERSEL